MMPIITLTTDFGADGPYVAAMKGVLLSLAPGCPLVDVSHAIPPQRIGEGAFVLASIVEAFPAGTIHVAVIDPGVGTDRALVAIALDGQYFLAPDNGLLDEMARLLGKTPNAIHQLANPEFQRAEVSSTFHGRDLLAPAAAYLATHPGRLSELGPAQSQLRPRSDAESSFPREQEPGRLVGRVLYRDRFGNLITNLRARHWNDPTGSLPATWRLEIGGTILPALSRTYGDHPPGSLIALLGSSGWLEIAAVNGSAADRLGADVGTIVHLVTELDPAADPQDERSVG